METQTTKANKHKIITKQRLYLIDLAVKIVLIFLERNMGDSYLSLKGISKTFGTVRAVENFNFDIAKGEFIVLVGPSGCGKSTLLRIIAGLEFPTTGQIALENSDVTGTPARERNVAMVFQDYALYPHMKVRENLAFGLEMRRVPRDEINTRVKKTADALQIGHLLERYPRQLSGGQKQRVALGRALIRQPRLFLLDEPLSNIDAELRVEMRAELLRLHRDLKITTIYVTHDQIEAMTLGQRIVVMKDGVVQQIGPPEQVYHQPANTFVARFIGTPSMNLIESKLTLSNGRVQFTVGENNASIAANNFPASQQDILVGIRPEAFSDQQNTIKIEGTIELIETLGKEKIVHLTSGKERFAATLRSDRDISVGSRITLYLNETQIYFFEASSGKLIRR